MKRRHVGWLMLGLFAACGAERPGPAAPDIRAAAPRTGASASELASFYHLEEGSEVFPVAWFEALENEDGSGMFADGLDRFGRLIRLTEGQRPEAQLALAGIGAADITHVVLTHSDIDHIGGIGAFEDAVLVMGTAERALDRPRYFPGAPPIPWPRHRRVQLVDADTELVPGLTVLSTPGHSPGHLSLLADLPGTGPIVITADAVSRPSQLHDGFADAWDSDEAMRQATRLMMIARDRRALVIFGHDPAQWPVLRKAPEWFD